MVNSAESTESRKAYLEHAISTEESSIRQTEARCRYYQAELDGASRAIEENQSRLTGLREELASLTPVVIVPLPATS